MRRDAILPWSPSAALRRTNEERVLVTRSGASLFMTRGEGIVLSMRAPGHDERVEIARIDDVLHMPHLVEVAHDAYFLSDTRRVYRLDTERFTVKSGHRLEADKVLPLVGLGGAAYAAYVVDGPFGYETKIARVIDEWTMSERTIVRGELIRMWSREGRLRASGARGVGRMFDLVWEPTLGLSAVTDRASQHGRPLLLPTHPREPQSVSEDRSPRRVHQLLPHAARHPVPDDEETTLARGVIRPEAPSDRPTHEQTREHLTRELWELEKKISRDLPAQYASLYELSFSDFPTRERLQRIGLFMVHPMLRTRAQMSRGLLPIAEATDDSIVCLDVSDEVLMPVVKLFRDDTVAEVGMSFGLFLENFLSAAFAMWPTTVRELRRTMEDSR